VVALTPFQIICAGVFGFTVYGMAGLRTSWQAILKNGLLNTLMYLIACQVRVRALAGLAAGDDEGREAAARHPHPLVPSTRPARPQSTHPPRPSISTNLANHRPPPRSSTAAPSSRPTRTWPS
jgi:hypothetical protein